MKRKVVIVGGGLSGLHCGLLLLKQGHDVTIFEQHNTAGGLAAGFIRKGYYFDSGMARIAADSLTGFLAEAGLETQIQFQKNNASLRIKDKTYPTRSVNDFISACADSFPDETSQLNKLFDDKIKKAAAFMIVQNRIGAMSYKGMGFAGKMLRTMVKTIISGNSGGINALMSATDTSLRQLLDEYLGEKSPLGQCLYGITSDLFNKGGETSLMTFIGSLCVNMELNKYPSGGFQQLCNIYSDQIKNLGGRLITSAKVTRIRCGNNRAEGVEYRVKGSTHFESADIVVNSADLNNLYLNLLDQNMSDGEYMVRLKKQETTSPVPIMYLGVKISSDILTERFAGAEELIYYPGYTGGVNEGDFYKGAPMILHSSCINNAEHAPKGSSNIQIYLSSPIKEWTWGVRDGEKALQYADIKKCVIQDVMEHVCALLPELEDKSVIEVCELGTPLTFERYTANKNGAHCGFTWDRTRNNINPKIGTCDTRHSKITNLFITGHWTGYLGGVTNAFASARQVTKQIKDI